MPHLPSRIHLGLVGARELVGEPYLADPELRRQYAQEIAPRTTAALEKILAELSLPTPARVLDLGAGTGAASDVIRRRWPTAEVIAVDKVGGPGIVQADLARAGQPPGVRGRFDLVVAAHLLNELALGIDARASLVEGWCRELLGAEGTLVLIEPALRETSRALLAVRDRLLAAGLCVVAPCLLQAPCPALVRERDFCHASAVAVASGRSRVDYSYLVLRWKGSHDGDSCRYRVVSDPMKDKGRLRLFICGARGRQVITRLDRDRSERNRAMDEAGRGDVVRVAGVAERGDGWRCTEDTEIARG